MCVCVCVRARARVRARMYVWAYMGLYICGPMFDEQIYVSNYCAFLMLLL